MRPTPWSALTLTLLIVSGVGHSRALDKAPVVSAKVRAEQLQTATAKLQKGDEASIRQGFSALTELGGDAAAEAVVARLRRGLPPQLIEAAIDSLVLLDRPAAGAALLELTQHRRIQIRIKAMQAIGALRQKSAQSALLYALDDPSSEVRSAAVDALGVVGNARAVKALLAAAERDVPGAWSAIGALASPADVKLLLAHAPAGDVTLIRPALDAMIARKDLPVQARARMVLQVAALGSPSARMCMSDWVAKGAGEPPPLKRALTQALAKLERESPLDQVAASGAAVGGAPAQASGKPVKDPKAAKGAAGLPAPAPNVAKRAAAAANPRGTASASTAQGAP